MIRFLPATSSRAAAKLALKAAPHQRTIITLLDPLLLRIPLARREQKAFHAATKRICAFFRHFASAYLPPSCTQQRSAANKSGRKRRTILHWTWQGAAAPFLGDSQAITITTLATGEEIVWESQSKIDHFQCHIEDHFSESQRSELWQRVHGAKRLNFFAAMAVENLVQSSKIHLQIGIKKIRESYTLNLLQCLVHGNSHIAE